MKNLLFGIIATVLSTVTYAQNEIKPSEYGFYHNEAIKLFTEKHINANSDLSSFTIEAVANGMLSELKNKYPAQFKNATVAEALEYYKNYKMITDYDFQANWDKNKLDYLKKGDLSELTFNLIEESVKNNYDSEELSLAIKKLKSSPKLSDKDKLSLEVAESVLNSSNELWVISKYNLKAKRRNHCNGRILISDFGTAMMFAPAPYLSLFAGAISSLITAYSDGDCK